MVIKRPFGEGQEDDYEALNHEAKQRIASSNFTRNVINGISCQELASTLEPLIRGWVRDEVRRACQSFCCSSPRSPFNALEPCDATPLQLRFESKFPHMVFTGTRVESEDNNEAVKIVLFDTESNKIVSSGPLSSIKVQIVPLDGDFCIDDDENWSQKDFEEKVICARDGKRPLVTGDLMVILKNGVGELGDVFFTDNSSWRRSRTFRLGAQVASVCGARIREAKSEAFVVKDHRGESYKKHHPPCLDDEIWRLDKIAKDGAFHKRLGLSRICTVKDFLQVYVTNESSLRKILGGSSNKTWDTIIKHAKDCVLDDKIYMYNCGTQGIVLLFNSIFKVVGATFDGQNYTPVEKLAGFQMPLVESLKQQFYKNLHGMLPINDLSVFGASMLTSNLVVEDQLQMQVATSPYMYGVDNHTQSELHSSTPFFSPSLRNSFIFKDFGNGPYGEGSSSGPNMLSTDFGYQMGSSSSLWQGNELCVAVAPCNQILDDNNNNNISSDFHVRFSRNGSGSGSPRGRWCKIRAAVKWVSVMRDVAAKRMAELYPYLDFST